MAAARAYKFSAETEGALIATAIELAVAVSTAFASSDVKYPSQRPSEVTRSLATHIRQLLLKHIKGVIEHQDDPDITTLDGRKEASGEIYDLIVYNEFMPTWTIPDNETSYTQ